MENLNFIIDISMPPLIDELKAYGGFVIILKEKNQLEEDLSHSCVDNVIKIYSKSLAKISDFDKVMELLKNVYQLNDIDYIFPFNELKFKIYYEFINKYHLKSNLKASYVQNCEKIMSRKLINLVFNDVIADKLINIDIDNFKYPAIIKPIFGNGSTNILKVNSKSEMKQVLKTIKIEDYFVETFINGIEISIEAIHYAGKHLIYGITRKLKYPNSFVEAGHIADQYQLTQNQLNKVLKIFNLLEYDNTLSHTEFMLMDDDIIMIESHSRLGGDLIPSFYEEKFSHSADMYHIFVKCLMGDLNYVDELKKLNKTKFSLFPIPTKFPAQIYLDTEVETQLKERFNINLLIQNKVNGSDINISPLDSFDRPLTLRGEIDTNINIDQHIVEINDFCQKNIFKFD